MTVNLLKLCVGIEDIEHLAEVQANRPELRHVTRNTPRRAAEVLDGGALYWVIKGFIRVRQRIVGLDPAERSDGRPACAIVLDRQLIKTELRAFRAFQGWRYFPFADAPPDLDPNREITAELPVDMEQELRSLGLL